MILPLALSLLAMTANISSPTESTREKIRILPVARVPEPTTVVLRMPIPKDGEILPGNPIWIQIRVDGYALGSSSPFERADEIAVSNMGQTIHVMIDNQPYFAINEGAINPFNEDGYFYDTYYKFEIPYRLKEGMHTIRMYPARSFGESLKGENTFLSSYFYVGEEKNVNGMDLSKPYITYNEPSDQMDLIENQPVLLDFIVSNCELSADGYKVRLTIDGKIKRTLTSWQPYYIYGLTRGRHTIRLELLNANNDLVSGIFNDTERSIVVR